MVHKQPNQAAWIGAALLVACAQLCLAASPRVVSGSAAFMLGAAAQDQPALATDPNTATGEAETRPAATRGYRGVSKFFNIREANSNVRQGEWELELTTGWATRSDGEDDELEFEQSLKYGVTDRFHIELEVKQPSIGDGGESGAGDMDLIFFYQFLEESDTMPALGGFAAMRIPSGDGSSKVDGTFSLIATKSLTDRVRVHFQGFVQTANGHIGEAEGDRRPFQWGLGPGMDCQIAEDTVALINYLHRSSEYRGHHNMNILEFGLIHEFGQVGRAEHGVKLAFDVGLDGAEETPNFAAALQYYLEWQ